MEKRVWGKDLQRVIQYNLQVRDTGSMEPEEMAEDARRLGADAVVLNVGGIYAWYESKVPGHHINEFLPEGRKLLEELIDACHRRKIAVIGRFDFSKAEDRVYLEHPQWFVKDPQGKPVIYGGQRMGAWSLLVSTCINGGYRREAFAGRVLEEALRLLKLDGVFFNAPHMEDCWCENCQRKYQKMYHKELPKEKSQWEKDWKRRCLQENMEFLYRKIKQTHPPLPVVMYYSTYSEAGMELPEDLESKYRAADLICTEAQDILSAGKAALPYRWKPVLNMKLGRLLDGSPPPFGIIHSCTGMDWRHTGLPAAEHEYWMSQIPASGGQLWHSLTGFGKTITDRRMLETVRRVNEKAAISNRWMKDASPAADVLLLWDGGKPGLDMAKAFLECHICFELLNVSMVSPEWLSKVLAVALPDGVKPDAALARLLEEYVRQGGNLLVERTDTAPWPELETLMGILLETSCAGELQAAYGVLDAHFSPAVSEDIVPDESLSVIVPEDLGPEPRLGETRFLPVRGRYLCVQPEQGTMTLMTLVPPFAPPDGVGAPPERASFPVERTKIPLALYRTLGKGAVTSVCFALSALVVQIGLEDQKLLLEQLFRTLAGKGKEVLAEKLPDGVHLSVWKKEQQGKRIWLLQLVNGTGERPLREGTPLRQLEVSLRVPADRCWRAASVLEHHPVTAVQTGDRLKLCLSGLDVWDLIVVEEEEDHGVVEEKTLSNDTEQSAGH